MHVRSYVCIHIYTYPYVHACMKTTWGPELTYTHIHMHIRTFIHIMHSYTETWSYTYAHTHTHTYNTYLHREVGKYEKKLGNLNLHTHTYIHMQIHILTHIIHTYTGKWGSTKKSLATWIYLFRKKWVCESVCINMYVCVYIYITILCMFSTIAVWVCASGQKRVTFVPLVETDLHLCL